MNASNRAEGGTSAFSLVADPGRRLVVTATTSRYFFRHPVVAPFCEGVMRRTKRGWDLGPLFFWQFVNGTHGTPGCLTRVVLLERVQRFRRVRPLVAGGTPCRLFYCLWTTEPDRHALPKLSDPLLLPGEHQEEGEWVENTRVQTSGNGRPPEVFFCDVAVLSTKVAGPFLYSVSCEIYTHFTVGQRDRCKPTVTTDLHMSYT